MVNFSRRENVSQSLSEVNRYVCIRIMLSEVRRERQAIEKAEKEKRRKVHMSSSVAVY